MNPEIMSLDLFTTLDESKEWLKNSVENSTGAICPCCQRLDKVYTRQIHKAQVGVLLQLYKHSIRNGQSYYHSLDFYGARGRSGDWHKFRFIGLIDCASNDNPAKKSSATYRITDKGMDFCESRATIPSHLIIYHNELIGVSPDNKTILELYPEFNYQELMSI